MYLSSKLTGVKLKGILSILFFTLSVQVYGQSSNLFGFKGGPNISTLGKTGSGYTSKLGYNLGFYSSSRFYQELGVQMELLISQQGARSEILSDLKLNYTYLTAPLFVNFYIFRL